MKDKPKITDAEWRVMQVLWEKSPICVKEIIQKLTPNTDWKSETIRTLVNRLVKKGIIDYEKRQRQHFFFPLYTQSQCVEAEAESFLTRAGSAILKPILTNFIEKEKLSADEIAQLRKILDGKGDKK